MELRKTTDFKSDVVTYGPIGESDLISILSTNKQSKIFDVSSIKKFQDLDIDIVKASSDSTIDDVINSAGTDVCDLLFDTFEVKTDTVGLTSRNIIYEIFSNGNIGCLARTKAKYLYYVFIDKNNMIVERYVMKMKTLNLWLMSEFKNINRVSYLTTSYMSRDADNTAIFKINIDNLVRLGIAKKI